MKPEGSAERYQTLSSLVRSGHETMLSVFRDVHYATEKLGGKTNDSLVIVGVGVWVSVCGCVCVGGDRV